VRATKPSPLVFAAAFCLLLGVRPLGASPSSPAPRWGRIANSLHRGERILSALYFAGPPNPHALPLYTRHPLHADQLDARGDAGTDYALNQMTGVGLNTVKLSYWGHDGETDLSASTLLFSQTRWPGDPKAGAYTEAEQIALGRHFFERAQAHDLLIAPLLEVGPSFPFYADFPDRLDGLVERASWLLQHFGEEPNWLRVYDQNGLPRRVVWLIESIHGSPIDPKVFAQGFGTAAFRLKKLTRYDVGFILDPTPLPPYGAEYGPDPDALQQEACVLAINPFNITSQGVKFQAKLSEITEEERQQYAESVLRRWHGSTLPLIAPLLPGYDAHLVFPKLPIYGFSDAWRRRQKELAVQYETDGVSFDIWNGWTEGYAIPPSVEEGEVNFQWAKEAIQAVKAAPGR
jgi:hypothetical protein